MLKNEMVRNIFGYREGGGKTLMETIEFYFSGSVHHESILIVNQQDATVRSPIYFTARSLCMFRVSSALIIRGTLNCNYSLRYRTYELYRRL